MRSILQQMATASFSGRQLHCPQPSFAGPLQHAHNLRHGSRRGHALQTGRIVAAANSSSGNSRVIRGPCFVTRDVSALLAQSCFINEASAVPRLDSRRPNMNKAVTLHLQNIDTDQIIPAEYLTLVPSKVCRHLSHIHLTSVRKKGQG